MKTFNYVKPEDSRYSERLHIAREASLVVRIPVIGGGGIGHPELAEQALQDNMADMIFVGRGILADTAWVRKTIKGKADLIVPCRKCRKCFHFTDSSKYRARILKIKSGL